MVNNKELAPHNISRYSRGLLENDVVTIGF